MSHDSTPVEFQRTISNVRLGLFFRLYRLSFGYVNLFVAIVTMIASFSLIASFHHNGSDVLSTPETFLMALVSTIPILIFPIYLLHGWLSILWHSLNSEMTTLLCLDPKFGRFLSSRVSKLSFKEACFWSDQSLTIKKHPKNLALPELWQVQRQTWFMTLSDDLLKIIYMNSGCKR